MGQLVIFKLTYGTKCDCVDISTNYVKADLGNAPALVCSGVTFVCDGYSVLEAYVDDVKAEIVEMEFSEE